MGICGSKEPINKTNPNIVPNKNVSPPSKQFEMDKEDLAIKIVDCTVGALSELPMPFGTAFKLFSGIIETGKQARINQTNCALLSERCEVLSNVVKHFAAEMLVYDPITEKHKFLPHYETHIQLMEKVVAELQETNIFLNSFRDLDTPMKQFVSAEKAKEGFEEHEKKLTRTMADFEQSMNADNWRICKTILEQSQIHLYKVDAIMEQLQEQDRKLDQIIVKLNEKPDPFVTPIKSKPITIPELIEHKHDRILGDGYAFYEDVKNKSELFNNPEEPNTPEKESWVNTGYLVRINGYKTWRIIYRGPEGGLYYRGKRSNKTPYSPLSETHKEALKL